MDLSIASNKKIDRLIITDTYEEDDFCNNHLSNSICKKHSKICYSLLSHFFSLLISILFKGFSQNAVSLDIKITQCVPRIYIYAYVKELSQEKWFDEIGITNEVDFTSKKLCIFLKNVKLILENSTCESHSLLSNETSKNLLSKCSLITLDQCKNSCNRGKPCYY